MAEWKKKPVHSSLHRQKARYEPLKLAQLVDLQISTQQMIQSINNVPGINIKTYTRNTRLPFFLVSLIRKPSIFTGSLPSPVILREAEGEVAESTTLNEPSPSGRGGTVDNDR